MLNHAARAYLPVFHDPLRTSVLGRAMARKTRNLQQPGAADEEGAIPSPATGEHVRKFFDAWHVGDDDGLKEAMGNVVQTWRADNAAGGVPVHGHMPLPDEFAEGAAHLLKKDGDIADIGRMLTDIEPGVKALILKQLGGFMNDNPTAADNQDLRHQVDPEHRGVDDRFLWTLDGGATSEEAGSVLRRFSIQERREPNLSAPFSQRELVHGGLDDLEYPRSGFDRGALRTMEDNRARDGYVVAETSPWDGQRGQVQKLQGAPVNQPTKQEPPRIVRPYRRYLSPGLTPQQMAEEDRQADALARDADKHIRELIRAIESDRLFVADRDPLVTQFLQALKRYYAENGDRAVVSPRPGDRRASMDSKDHLAAYDESSDRIVFSSLFKGLSREEKVITLMHELLHTTLIAKNEGARGYYRDRKGGMIYAKHEAWLDNLAIALAKRLRLIPQNYPETSWRRYYKR
jgi:hypothetical protein